MRHLYSSVLCRFFEKSSEAVQLFDGGGDFESSEFREHATRVIRRLQTEMDHLQDHDDSHEHDEDAPLSNTTPAIKTVCITRSCPLSNSI